MNGMISAKNAFYFITLGPSDIVATIEKSLVFPKEKSVQEYVNLKFLVFKFFKYSRKIPGIPEPQTLFVSLFFWLLKGIYCAFKSYVLKIK